jgi:poly-gamma-glutamate synthesis protein (capsule biosynthesis protein)
MDRQGDTYDSVPARFTVTKAEAVPLHVHVGAGHVRIVPADPDAIQRVAAVLDGRGAVAAGLGIVPG